MVIKYKVRFLLHHRKTSLQELAIRMRVSIPKHYIIDIPLGCKVKEVEWNEKGQFVQSSSYEAGEINRLIYDCKRVIRELFATYELINKELPSRDTLKAQFASMVDVPIQKKEIVKKDGFFDVFDKFVNTVGRKNDWTDSTYEKFSTLKAHLIDFKEDISLDEIDDNLMLDYTIYLQDAIKMRNSTVAKSTDFVKWFLRWAANNKYYKGNAHDTFKPKLKGNDSVMNEIIYLGLDELNKLSEYEVPSHLPSLDRVKDVFLFCCYTSIRYSDVLKLRRKDIYEGYIRVITKKTNTALKIELNKHSREILDKYKSFEFSDDKALPVISNVKMNKHLKRLGQLAQLDQLVTRVYFIGNKRFEETKKKYELLTTHCARRTFVVTALQLGIPAEVIMRWTGHSDHKSMKPYIAIVDELKKAEMTKFDSI